MNPTSGTTKMRPGKRNLLLLGFGLLPLWAAIALVVAGSFLPGASHEYWNVAPWAIVAAIPASGITMAIAIAAVMIFNRSGGGDGRKARISTAWFFGLVGLVVLAIIGGWMKHRASERQSRVEQAAAMEFVTGHEAVVRAFGPVRRTDISSRSTDNSQLGIWIEGERKGYAIVRGLRTREGLSFVLACTLDEKRSPHGRIEELCR